MVRGKIVTSSRFVFVVNGKEMRFSGPTCIVRLDTRVNPLTGFPRVNGRKRHEFRGLCKRMGIVLQAMPSDEHDGRYNHSTGKQVADDGTTESCFVFLATDCNQGEGFEFLESHPDVESVEFLLDTRVPFVAGGSGCADGSNARRAIRETRMSKPERLAVREREEWEAVFGPMFRELSKTQAELVIQYRSEVLSLLKAGFGKEEILLALNQRKS